MDNVLTLYKLDENGVKQPFPDAENNVISTFTYSAKRMGGAPAISCTFKYPTCLDNYWNENVIVEFRKETFFVRKTPTSSYSNTEALYSHEVTLVSERIILENVYFFDCVYKYGDDYQVVVNSTSVPFFGKIDEFAQRLNYSLQYSGLQIADKETGNYVSGYRVIVDRDEQGTDTTLYEKGYLITAQDQFFANVLQESYNTYKIPYYFDGKEIHIGFGFLDEVITEANNEPFEYGIDHSLLSIKKQNSNNKIVNRITGVGSADNIPYYYPNPTSVGTIHAEFNQDGQIKNDDVVKIDADKFLAATSLDKDITFKYFPKDFVGTSKFFYMSDKNGTTIELNDADYDGNGYTIHEYQGIETIKEFQQGGLGPIYKFIMLYKMRFDVTCTEKMGSFKMHLNITPKRTTDRLSIFNPSMKETPIIEERVEQDGKVEFVRVGALQQAVTSQNEKMHNYYGEVLLGNFSEGKKKTFIVSWMYSVDYYKGNTPIGIPYVMQVQRLLEKIIPNPQYIWTYEDKKKNNISDLGIELKSSVAEDIEKKPSKYDGTSFKVVRDKYIQPQPNLMPSIYRNSEGAERFYNAINNEYDDGAGNKITFPKPYIEGHPSEHIENFEDIKPTIKGITNGNEQPQPFDQFLAIAYDKDDNDEQDAEGNYYHPYFFAKLPKYDGDFGFNLFEHAIDEGEMSISMTSGHCGACEFVIVVDDKEKKNKVQVDEYGNLMYNPNGNVICGRKEYVDGEWQPQKEKSDPKDKQNDTRNNEVWVALRKDYNTFGTLYPKKGSIEPKAEEDTFVILHIDMPQQYIDAAEKRLDDALIKYMLENNEEKFSFSMNMSRIYLANNPDIRDNINENSKVKIKYNGSEHILYISSYTYKASGKDALPEITVELKDAVTIQKNAVENAVGQVKTDLLSTLNPQNIALQVMQYFIRKDVNDIAKGRITFQQGLTSLGRAIFGDSIQSENYVGGLDVGRGWSIDNNGNAEFESLRVRSLLEVVELVINRLQAQEGDMLFTDNDQIDYVSVYTSGEETSYILTLKEKYEGYIHTQAYGNILKGTINTLAAQHAGVTDDLWLKNDYSDVDTADLESDIAGNTYYTSWMRVVGTYKTEPMVCDVNQIRVVLYGDDKTPANKNFIPCELMTIARWGCIDYVDGDPELFNKEGLTDDDAISKSIERRQRLFSISNSDGRIVKLRKVNKPKLEKHNYGTTIGILPEFVPKYTGIEGRLSPERDYLYAQGIVVSDLIKITPTGDPIVNIVDRGQWEDNTPYFNDEYNTETAQWETHDVWHYGLKWRCLQSQPVNKTYFEPTWDSAYWQPIEGDMSLTMEFTSSNGYSFRRNAAWETEIKPHIFFGGIEITNYTQKVTISRWERKHEVGTDETKAIDAIWNNAHTGLSMGDNVATLTLNSQNDISPYWSSKNKMIFTCYAEVGDGSNKVIVENQIIA